MVTTNQPGEPRASLLGEQWAEQTIAIILIFKRYSMVEWMIKIYRLGLLHSFLTCADALCSSPNSWYDNIFCTWAWRIWKRANKLYSIKLFTLWSLDGRISHKTTYGCGNICFSALLPFLLLAAFNDHIGHWNGPPQSTDAVALRTRTFGDVGTLRHVCNQWTYWK